ncbi:MAG: hypothetical protein EOP48_30895 [Sphingobacteriales bacterium]|nr:MAG: hypothetical protein EOP48_30895 [Sphingobacteriales bacterium]
MRETEAGDSKIGTAKLLDEFYIGGDIGWLRKLRNKYVHLDLNSPALTMNYQYHERESMENEAKRAMKMIIHAFFQSPGNLIPCNLS